MAVGVNVAVAVAVGGTVAVGVNVAVAVAVAVAVGVNVSRYLPRCLTGEKIGASAFVWFLRVETPRIRVSPTIAIAASASFSLTRGHAIFAKQNPIDAQWRNSTRHTFNCTRSHSMKPILLLSEPEIVRVTLKQVTSGGFFGARRLSAFLGRAQGIINSKLWRLNGR